MVPPLKATWSLRGSTPIVAHRNRWHRKVSVIGALALEPDDGSHCRLLTDWHPDRHVTQAEVVGFLGKLLRQFPGRPITLVWDKLQAHRGKPVQRFVADHPELEVHFLPSYAPDLNPVEPVWCISKHHGMANHGIDDLRELCATARRHVRRVGRSRRLLRSCLAHAGVLDALCHASAQ